MLHKLFITNKFKLNFTPRIRRPSQNELRWPLSFHIRLKSFGFSLKKGVSKFPPANFIILNRFPQSEAS